MRLSTYTALFHVSAFRRFWLGFTFSALGDAMTRVALIWYVYQSTHSPQALGLLLLCYTGPVIVGGLLAGFLLDRFDRHRVMLIDNALRGAVVALIPLLSVLGALALWQIYVVAVAYGFFYMITLAGTPSLLPALVAEEQLSTANALETLSYTLSGVCGPPLAGILIAWLGAPNVVVIDALSYAAFALALAGISLRPEARREDEAAGQPAYGLRVAVQLLLSNSVLLSTTLMFMAFNVGEGFLWVWLPIFADRLAGGRAELYGVLLGALALGEIAGAVLAGSMRLQLSLGTLICLSQLFAGISLGLLVVGQLVGQSLGWALVSLILLGVFSAPLTIWAQTLRMRIIPERLRGRTFALLRTLMQGSGPLASALAGVLLPVLGLGALISCSAAAIGIPGLVGYRIPELRQGGTTEAEHIDTPRGLKPDGFPGYARPHGPR
jgi:MFS family permease